jgi:hypothetical protein
VTPAQSVGERLASDIEFPSQRLEVGASGELVVTLLVREQQGLSLFGRETVLARGPRLADVVEVSQFDADVVVGAVLPEAGDSVHILGAKLEAPLLLCALRGEQREFCVHDTGEDAFDLRVSDSGPGGRFLYAIAIPNLEDGTTQYRLLSVVYESSDNVTYTSEDS